MITRIAIFAAVVALGVFALWHPAARPPIVNAGSTFPPAGPQLAGDASAPLRRHHGSHRDSSAGGVVVYVAGSVKRPGLYRLREGDRAEQAVALAGGFTMSADAAGVNLAAHAADGDEIYVPAAGERSRVSAGTHRSRRHSTPPPNGSVDVNRAGPGELAAVPGIGRAVAGRIVELREREGSFTSLDELLDVAGMTQSRLERARPYLREP